MEPQFVCMEKQLAETDVNRNLEVRNQARFLPEGNGIMLITDRDRKTYEFVASRRRSGRRSLTRQWIDFAASKGLRAGEFIRINWTGHENHYEVQAANPTDTAKHLSFPLHLPRSTPLPPTITSPAINAVNIRKRDKETSDTVHSVGAVVASISTAIIRTLCTPAERLGENEKR
ncbi:unnamed protein product [Ilex paraguariensis]|uniref:TF-B3 domain-containing protein n=1 Tax=Ilex paraguariensis TaxID=185542 RepID=A0ABC8S4V4_9AQUA